MEGSKVLQLSCTVRNYKWGKIGEQSEVALLAKNQLGFQMNLTEPYAELWMGMHPQGMSKVIRNDGSMERLVDVIDSNPDLVGDNISKIFGNSIPYLFKVLSIDKALSIQAHPTKQHAELLHRLFPDRYPDPNHKPEMAIAITRFEALCGFRPLNEILRFFKNIPELTELVKLEAIEQLSLPNLTDLAVQNGLRKCVNNLMECDEGVVKMNAQSLFRRLREAFEKDEDMAPCLGSLFIRIYEQFPDDVGCFMIYFLNYLLLEPSESIFLGPNLPHAYLSGDIVECMACSDNVVRAGLTPKFKDVKTLVEMLNYAPQTIDEIKFQPKNIGEFVNVYDPPVKDFAVRKIYMAAGEVKDDFTCQKVAGPSIFIVIKGSCEVISTSNDKDKLQVNRGSVFFVSCNEIVKLNNISSDNDLLIFQAYCE